MLTILILLLVSLQTNIQKSNEKNPMESDISELFEAIDSRKRLDKCKQEKVRRIQQSILYTDDSYGLYKELYNEYKSYNFDTALVFANHLEQIASISNDKTQRYEALLAKGFTYLSGGLFKESMDVLDTIEAQGLPVDDEYYITYARLLWDMANYLESKQEDEYTARGIQYMEQAADYLLQHKDTARYWFCKGSIDLRSNQNRRGIERFLMALQGKDITPHDSAVLYSSIAHQHFQVGDREKAFHYYVAAACCDIRSNTKEAIAMRYVAKMLYEEGKIEQAEECIRIAHEDAVRYHARHRQLEISQILPIIEEHQLRELRQEKNLALILFGTVIILLCVVIVILWALMRRTKAVHRAQDTIEQMNETLIVANHVKEQLLSNLLAGQSQYLSEVEQYQQKVKHLAAEHRYAELQVIPRPADAHRRRQVFYQQLDEMLLDIYPSFVEDFNALLREGEKMELKANEKLNAEMRIFALMRLGIAHNEAIAQVMDYSVNTVYTYKTRTKNRSDLSTEQFLQAVMSIPSFNREKMAD